MPVTDQMETGGGDALFGGEGGQAAAQVLTHVDRIPRSRVVECIVHILNLRIRHLSELNTVLVLVYTKSLKPRGWEHYTRSKVHVHYWRVCIYAYGLVTTCSFEFPGEFGLKKRETFHGVKENHVALPNKTNTLEIRQLRKNLGSTQGKKPRTK